MLSEVRIECRLRVGTGGGQSQAGISDRWSFLFASFSLRFSLHFSHFARFRSVFTVFHTTFPAFQRFRPFFTVFHSFSRFSPFSTFSTVFFVFTVFHVWKTNFTFFTVPALFVAAWALSSLLVASHPFPDLYSASRVCSGLFGLFAPLSAFTVSVASRTSVFPRRGPKNCALLSKQPSAILCGPFRSTTRLSVLFRLRGYHFVPPLHFPVCALLGVLHTIRNQSWFPQKPFPPPVSSCLTAYW